MNANVPLKLQNELLVWIDNSHPYGISWVTDDLDKINKITDWLGEEFNRRLEKEVF